MPFTFPGLCPGKVLAPLAECLPLVGQVDVVFVCVIDDTASQIGNVAGLVEGTTTQQHALHKRAHRLDQLVPV